MQVSKCSQRHFQMFSNDEVEVEIFLGVELESENFHHWNWS